MKNVLSLAKNIISSNIKRLSFPYKLTFSITNRCNSRCKICYIWKRGTSEELTSKEIDTFFKKSNRFNWIDLTGGEIFLRDDLEEIINSILANCKELYLLHFPTNGMLTDRTVKIVEDIMPFMTHKKLIITVSLDGHEALHDDIRGVQGSYRKSIETFGRLRKIKGAEVYIGMTLSSYNYLQLDRIFESVKKDCPYLGFRDFHINIVHSSSFQYGNEGQIKPYDPKLATREINNFISRKSFNLNPVLLLECCYLRLIRRYLMEKKTPMPCKAFFSSCYINAEGDVYPCSLYDKKMGNIRDEGSDLKSIWENTSNIDILLQIKEKKCPNCWTPCEAYQSILGNLALLYIK
ncbi:radical SAM protein [Candidatus Omnitrophota bacterium]